MPEDPRPRRLWHYCCHHSVRSILASDRLEPHPGGQQHQLFRLTGMTVVSMPVIWLSDIDVATLPEVELLGLGANTGFISCDRVAYRFRVASTAGEWWPRWAERAVEAGMMTPKYRALLELDRAPEHWWVSEAPIRAPQLDMRYRRPSQTEETSDAHR